MHIKDSCSAKGSTKTTPKSIHIATRCDGSTNNDTTPVRIVILLPERVDIRHVPWECARRAAREAMSDGTKWVQCAHWCDFRH